MEKVQKRIVSREWREKKNQIGTENFWPSGNNKLAQISQTIPSNLIFLDVNWGQLDVKLFSKDDIVYQ